MRSDRYADVASPAIVHDGSHGVELEITRRFRLRSTGDGAARLIGVVHDPSHLNGIVAHLSPMNVELASIESADTRRAAPLRTDPSPNTSPERTNS